MVVEGVYSDPDLIFPTAAAIPPPGVRTLFLTALNSDGAPEAEEGGSNPDTVEEEVVADGPLCPGLAEAAARGCIAVADCP